MSRLGPYLEDALKNCIDAGATNITVIPYFCTRDSICASISLK